MSEDGRVSFARRAHRHTYQPEDILRREDQSADEVVFVLEGKVKVTTEQLDESELILGIFGPGHPSGGFGLFGETFPGRIEALTDVETAEIGRADFLDILDREPSASATFVEIATERNRHLIRRLHDATVAPAERRLALVFQMFREAWGESAELEGGESGVVVPLSIKRRDLAALINTRTETAIRLVRDWERSDILQTNADGFVITSPTELDELAGG
ncbi:MAG: Crp/Fnr family transcriptional regulator [Bradymonadaceae bacterium]